MALTTERNENVISSFIRSGRGESSINKASRSNLRIVGRVSNGFSLDILPSNSMAAVLTVITSSLTNDEMHVNMGSVVKNL